MLKELQEHQLDTGAVIMNYAKGPPSGPPLVLLHGGSGRWQNYMHIVPDLAALFHLYAPDFRGHGKSGRVPGRYRFQDYANDTITFLRQCVAEPACLLGHSLEGNALPAQEFDRARVTLYQMLGWGEQTGTPTAWKLHELSLGWVADIRRE